MLRRRSLAKLRHEIEPVDQTVLGRFSDHVAGDRQAAARRRRAARRDRAAAGRAAAGVDSRDRDSRRRASPATILPISTPSPRRAKSSGSASSRSASATAASRCISPTICRGCWRPRGRRASGNSTCPNVKPRSSTRFDRKAHRFSDRSTRRSAADIPAKPSTRSGIWSGRASSPTTPSTRCGRSPAPTRRGARRRPASRTSPRSARGASRLVCRRTMDGAAGGGPERALG